MNTYTPEVRADLVGKAKKFLSDGITAFEIVEGLSQHLKTTFHVPDSEVEAARILYEATPTNWQPITEVAVADITKPVMPPCLSIDQARTPEGVRQAIDVMVATAPAPEWATPEHTDIDLLTADPVALGLDPLSDDIKLIDSIEMSKYRKTVAAAPVAAAEPAAKPAMERLDDGPPHEVADQHPLRDSALHAIDLGLHVFALGIAVKEPDNEESPNGFKSSTDDRAKVTDIWTRKPDDNIGIDCGSSDLCVFDFDDASSIPAWVADFKTLKIKTSRGLHVYTRGARPQKRMFDADGRHIGEIKSTGGYVIWAQSVHPDGPVYTVVEDNPIAVVPDDKYVELTKHVPADINPGVNASGEKILIPHGQIHPWMLVQAGKLRNNGLTPEEIEPILLRLVHENCAPPIDDYKVRAMARSMKIYKEGDPTKSGDILFTQPPVPAGTLPIVDDPSDTDERFEMTGETFNTQVYEDMARRYTEYPDPGVNDLVSAAAHKYIHGTPIPLAFVREPLKAMALHSLDGQLIHPANPKMSLRGNYFNLAESEGGKTTGLEYALRAGAMILRMSSTHPEDLFRYKSEQTFIRSFTQDGTIKKDSQGNVKSGKPGNPSQFLYIKEGGLVTRCSDYFAAVFSRLTDLYDQTQAATESMSNGNFEANIIRVSTVMCFTPTDFVSTFTGKGTIGGGGLNRWALVNPPEDHSYDARDWEPLPDSELMAAANAMSSRVFELKQNPPVTLAEEPGAAAIRLEVKVLLKKAGTVGKRLLDYFMREQVAQAAFAVDGRLVMTTKQAEYAKRWVEAQLHARIDCWPSDANNQIEGMEAAIRKAVTVHFVSETRLKDICNFYRAGSGGWFTFWAAIRNAVGSQSIKLTGKTRKGIRAYCPESCGLHPAIDGTK